MPDIKLDEATGAWRDEDIRYVLIRADGLMSAFRDRPDGLAALAQSIYIHGRKSLIRYQTKSPDPTVILATVAGVASFLGWGVWSFSRDDRGLALIVRNSPFAAAGPSSSTAACAPILGMFRAVSELILHQPVTALEHACAASGAASQCEFRATAQAEPHSNAKVARL